MDGACARISIETKSHPIPGRPDKESGNEGTRETPVQTYAKEDKPGRFDREGSAAC